MLSFCFINTIVLYIEDITRWREDMNNFSISHLFAAPTRETLFLPREHKIHIFELTCNVLFIIQTH